MIVDIKESPLGWVDPRVLKERLIKVGIHKAASDINTIIEEFRIRHNIVIYNSADPHVDAFNEHHNIVFGYTVKKCYPGTPNGWNHRVIIGSTGWSDNPWQAKFEAIKMALEYVESKLNPQS